MSELDAHAPRRPKIEAKEKEREILLTKEMLEDNQFKWDSSEIDSQLPLLPGQSISVPVTIHGHVGWCVSPLSVVEMSRSKRLHSMEIISKT